MKQLESQMDRDIAGKKNAALLIRPSMTMSSGLSEMVTAAEVIARIQYEQGIEENT